MKPTRKIVSIIIAALVVLAAVVFFALKFHSDRQAMAREDMEKSDVFEEVSEPAASESSSASSGEEQQAQVIAKNLLQKVSAEEPAVTELLKGMETDGATLQGLDYRLKSQESLTRKILLDSHDKQCSLQEAADAIGDCLRYTLMSDQDDKYASMVDHTMKTLKDKGLTILKFKNFWGGEYYQGINVALLTPDQVKMELQFHTADSYNTKENLTHKYYEIMRSETAKAEDVAEAEKKTRDYQARVKIPKGAKNLSFK
jgi:flagellar basal body-associated protein FliL